MLPQARSPSSPRQFKAPIPSTHVKQKRARRAQRRSRNVNQPEEDPANPRMLPNPQLKAVTPCKLNSDGEEIYLRFLIHYFVSIVTAEKVTNVGPRFEWYPLAVRDDAFFHALMSSTASHVAHNRRVPTPGTYYHHRGIAIRMINERLERGAHDEGTINTVVIFALQEGYMGRTPTALIHLNGVLQLVADAGGLSSPALSAKTRRHVYLTDLTACLCLETQPRLRSAQEPSLKTYFGRKSLATRSYTRTFANRLFNFTGSALSDVAADVLWGLRNVSAILEAIHDGSVSAETGSPLDIQFSDRVEALQRRANDLWHVADPAHPPHALFRTFGWTCMVYIYAQLRELPPSLGMNPLVAGRVKAILEACPDLNVLLATFPELLLWQMFICGRIADPRDRPFFASQATKILLIRRLDDAADIIISSEAFLWPEREVGISTLRRSAPRRLTPMQEELDAL